LACVYAYEGTNQATNAQTKRDSKTYQSFSEFQFGAVYVRRITARRRDGARELGNREKTRRPSIAANQEGATIPTYTVALLSIVTAPLVYSTYPIRTGKTCRTETATASASIEVESVRQFLLEVTSSRYLRECDTQALLLHPAATSDVRSSSRSRALPRGEPGIMGFSLYNLFKAGLLVTNGLAIVHPKRVLSICKCSYHGSVHHYAGIGFLDVPRVRCIINLYIYCKKVANPNVIYFSVRILRWIGLNDRTRSSEESSRRFSPGNIPDTYT
jgi:hypothetical protein